MQQWFNTHKQEIFDDLKGLIAIQSLESPEKPGAPFGDNVAKALKYCLALSEQFGFKAINLDEKVGYAEWGEGEKTFAILAHVDIVPEGTGWTTDPLILAERDGKWFARGVLDDKGPCIAALYVMRYLKEIGIIPSMKVRLIFGTNEETGMECIKHYLSCEPMPDYGITPDASFPLIYAEKGITSYEFLRTDKHPDIISLKGGTAANMVPAYAEAVIKGNYTFKPAESVTITTQPDGTFKISATGKSAHASLPGHGVNAISILLMYLSDYIESPFINFYYDRIGMDYYGEKIGVAFEDESGKLTLNTGVLSDDGIIVNIRYPVTFNNSTIERQFSHAILPFSGMKVECKGNSLPLYVPKDSLLVQKLLAAYQKVTGDTTSVPLAIGGGTYARALKNAVAFGPVFPGEEETAHQKDEYISVESFKKTMIIYAEALQSLVI